MKNIEQILLPGLTAKSLSSKLLPKGENVQGMPLSTMIKTVQSLPDGFYELKELSVRFEIAKKENAIFFPSYQLPTLMPFLPKLINIEKANQIISQQECKACWGKGCLECDHYGVI